MPLVIYVLLWSVHFTFLLLCFLLLCCPLPLSVSSSSQPPVAEKFALNFPRILCFNPAQGVVLGISSFHTHLKLETCLKLSSSSSFMSVLFPTPAPSPSSSPDSPSLSSSISNSLSCSSRCVFLCAHLELHSELSVNTSLKTPRVKKTHSM